MLPGDANATAVFGTNARQCCGARGDGEHDDAKALASAIAHAVGASRQMQNPTTMQSKTLLLPAGTYVLNSSLSVPANAAWNLRIVGEGASVTHLAAGRAMHSVLNVTALGGPSGSPIPFEDLYVQDITIDGDMKANYSCFAPGLSRSRFTRVTFRGGVIAGLHVGYVT